MTLLIRLETSADSDAVHEINCLAFGRDDEARLVDALRRMQFARVSLVAELEGHVVGHILFSSMRIVTAEESMPALALAPLAVRPSHQRQGIGSALVRQGLDVCRSEGHRIVLVLGEPAYYQRFGFSSQRAVPLASPYAGESFMALELMPGALDHVTGQVEYPPPFGEV